MGLALRRILALTLISGLFVAAAWLVFGRVAYQGGYERAIAEGGVVIYGLIAASTAGVVALLSRAWRLASIREVAVLAFAAWAGEILLLTLFGGVLANELSPVNAWFYGLVATGGPLQPLAGLAGGWIGISVIPGRTDDASSVMRHREERR